MPNPPELSQICGAESADINLFSKSEIAVERDPQVPHNFSFSLQKETLRRRLKVGPLAQIKCASNIDAKIFEPERGPFMKLSLFFITGAFYCPL